MFNISYSVNKILFIKDGLCYENRKPSSGNLASLISVTIKYDLTKEGCNIWKRWESFSWACEKDVSLCFQVFNTWNPRRIQTTVLEKMKAFNTWHQSRRSNEEVGGIAGAGHNATQSIESANTDVKSERKIQQ